MAILDTYRRSRHKLGELRHHLRAFGPAQALQYRIHRFKGTDPIPIRVVGMPGPIFCRPHDSDSFVFEQIFRNKECAIALPRAPKLIIDAGANVGYSTVFLAAAYPDADVVAVEPDPANCALLRRHCEPFTNVRIVEAGLWTHRCRLRVANPKSQSWGYQFTEVPDGEPGGAPAVTVMDLLEESGHDRIDLFKVDIEGAETQLFSTAYRDWLDRVDTLAVEVHGPAAQQAIDAACDSATFDRSQLGEKLVLARKAAVPA